MTLYPDEPKFAEVPEDHPLVKEGVFKASECKMLAEEQGCPEKYAFYEKFEEIAKDMVRERTGRPICANVDYYSGFAYTMLGIPEDLFTPLFAIARIAGWVAHNIENKMYDGKIMRPATKYIGGHLPYLDMKVR